MIEAPYPELDELLNLIGAAGHRLSEIDASEGAAGNISVYAGWSIDPRRKFPLVEKIDLPLVVPELAGSTFLVTGSGRRLREIIQDPAANLGCVVVDAGGKTGDLFTSPLRLFEHLTSEFNSHLAVHYDQVLHLGHELPCCNPCPTPILDLPEPHPTLPGQHLSKPAYFTLAAGADRPTA